MHFARKISCKPFRGFALKTFPVLVTGFLLALHTASAQIADDFSDGEFSSSPPWSGTTGDFIVNSEHQLQLSATVAGKSWLSFGSSPDFTQVVEWSLFIQQSFSPSGANFGRYYLTSDQSDLSGPLNGYFLQCGEAGSNDAIELFRQSGTSTTSVCRATSAAIASAFTVRLKIIRTPDGEWQLFADYEGGTDFVPEASGTDGVLRSSLYSGVLCTYTITNAARFIFDDFIVKNVEQQDTEPPVSVSYYYRDVVFSEIFADPSPQVGLPDVEFVELYNRTQVPADLGGWTFSDATTSAPLPPFILLPGEYAIITTASGAAKFNSPSRTLGVSAFPSLNNAGDVIVLRDSKGTLIDSLKFSQTWYRDSEKSEGGWSLELIDPQNICEDAENWVAATVVSGGTPGAQNSVHAHKPDNMGPKMLEATAIDSLRITIRFDEKLDVVTPPASSFVIQPSIEILSVEFLHNSRSALDIILSEPIIRSEDYVITATEIYDCPGNRIQEAFSRATFILPEAAEPGDIVVNELLFNPRPMGVDFVEIFNRSTKVIDVNNWSARNALAGSGKNEAVIATQTTLLFPGDFRVFTSQRNVLKGEYISTVEAVVVETVIPPLNDDEGSVALMDDKGRMIDSIYYSAKMHSPFVQEDEGISLERISARASGIDASNWTSASSASGFATPGYANSNVRYDVVSGDGPVTVEPEIIRLQVYQNDFARIEYRFQQGGFIGNVRIYDQQGRAVRQLASNELLGTDGFFRWDGDREDGSAAGTGYYMVWFEVFDAQGTVKTYRRRVAIF
ncbi:MAG: lamin tail domain-containing protein [Bacteroidota bacterium]|nr:lamin tail domain-containing protein [Bacteroidota bacterium]